MSSPSACAGQKPYDAAAREGAVATISSSSVVRVVVQLARHRLVEDRRELALQLPGQEEELPVDHLAQLGERRRRPRAVPVNAGTGRSSNATGSRFARAAASGSSGAPLLARRAARAAAPARRGCSTSSSPRAVGVEQVGHHADDPGRVEHVHGRRCSYAGAIRTAVCWRDVVAPPISSGSLSPRRCISVGDVRPSRPATA